MTHPAKTEERILLGVGEFAAARLPTASEQATLGIGPHTPVLVVGHADREPDVIRAHGVTVAADNELAEGCDGCLRWELRHLVAIRAAYYLTLHIREPQLRETVVHHVTDAWTQCVDNGGSHDGFHQFFDAYCLDVERDVAPELLNTPQHPAEYRRVWTNHAWLLRGKPDQIVAHESATAHRRSSRSIRRSPRWTSQPS